MLNENRKEFQPIPLGKVDVVDVRKWNVRTLDRDKKIDELAESISKYGLLQPIVVFKEGDKYKLVIGQRRLRAFKLLKRKDIPAVILPKKPDEEGSKILSLSENIHRVDLNRADIVEVISFLFQRHKKSARKVAKILGKSLSFVYDHLKIQDAPQEIKQMLAKGDIVKEDVKRLMEIAGDNKHKMIRLAEEMKTMTPPERKRLGELGKTRPKTSVAKLIEGARKPHIEEKVIVPLSPHLRMALDRAVKEIGLSREEIAKRALADWLNTKGYLREENGKA